MYLNTRGDFVPDNVGGKVGSVLLKLPKFLSTNGGKVKRYGRGREFLFLLRVSNNGWFTRIETHAVTMSVNDALHRKDAPCVETPDPMEVCLKSMLLRKVRSVPLMLTQFLCI